MTELDQALDDFYVMLIARYMGAVEDCELQIQELEKHREKLRKKYQTGEMN